MEDINKTDTETSGFDQLSVLFRKEVHCAGCDGDCACKRNGVLLKIE